MRVVTLALVFCFAIAAVHGIPQRPPIITTNKDRRLIAKVIGSNNTAETSPTTEASVTSTTVAATSDEVNPEEEAEEIEEEAEGSDPRHADSKQGEKLSGRPRQAKWMGKKQPAVETAEKIQPENKRNKKSTTTFCVEIRPSGSYKPFQVCEKEPAYEQSSYGGAQQPGYKPQEYSAPYPPKASYGPPSPPAYAAPPKVSYPAAAPSYGAAKQEAASEAYAAPKPAHPSAAYGAAPAAASSGHSSGSPATSSGYGSPSSSPYRAHEEEQKARMMDGEAEDVESEMRSASYGDDYGYGGPSYGAPPVAYIPNKDMLFEKLGKKKAPHSGLVVTCNPSFAGYASRVPSYGGMKYRNSGKSGRGGHKSPKSAYAQSSYSSSSSSGGHYGGGAAAGGYKGPSRGGYGASASGYGDHSAPASGGYGGSSSYASSGYERPAQSNYGGYSAPAQPNYAPPQPSYAAPPASQSYAPPPPPKYAPAPAPPSYAPPPPPMYAPAPASPSYALPPPPPKYAPAPAPPSYAPPPPPKYAPAPPPPKYAPAPSYPQPSPAPQQNYGPPPPSPAAYGGDQQAEESGSYVQPRPSAPAYQAPPAPPKYNAPAYVAPATYRASDGGDMKKMDEKSVDEDGDRKQAMSMQEKQAKTLDTMRKIAEQREAGMDMGRMAKVDDAIKKVEEKSEGGIEMGGEAGWSELRTDGRKAEDKGWEAKARKDEDGEMEDDVKPNLV